MHEPSRKVTNAYGINTLSQQRIEEKKSSFVKFRGMKYSYFQCLLLALIVRPYDLIF